MKCLDLYIFGFIVVLIVLVILGVLLNLFFLVLGNIINVLVCLVFIGMIVVGMIFVIIVGGFDLLVGLMVVFLVGLVIIVMNVVLFLVGSNWGMILIGMGVVIFGGIIVGYVNGVLIIKVWIEFFIVMLGMMGIFWLLVIWLVDGGMLFLEYGLCMLYCFVYYGGIGWIIWLIIVFVVVVIIGEWMMWYFCFGCYVEVIGLNDWVVKYFVIDVNCVKLMIYLVLGLLVGLVIVLYVLCFGFVLGLIGVLWELEVIVVVIIGGIVLKGGIGWVWGMVVGVLILFLIDNILNLVDLVSFYLNGVIQGVIIVFVVVLQWEKCIVDEW